MYSVREKILAWGVHAYSMLGLIGAGIIGVCIVHGTPASFQNAFWFMWLATIVDATDGFLARKARVKEVTPTFDGRRLDDLIDFINYTYLPLLLLWRAQILPPDLTWLLLVPLLASSYGFCQSSAKTDDGYFLGFPSYWNLIAFYVYSFCPPVWLTLTVILGFGFLTFIPSRYLYSTQPGLLNKITNVFAFCWAPYLMWLLFKVPAAEFIPGRVLETPLATSYYLSLIFPVYYFSLSWAITFKLWRKK